MVTDHRDRFINNSFQLAYLEFTCPSKPNTPAGREGDAMDRGRSGDRERRKSPARDGKNQPPRTTQATGSCRPGSSSVPGLPQWVTDDWIDETIRVWQPYYKDPLTINDAVEIILSWDRLLKVLREEPAK